MGTMTIVGLGPGDAHYLTREAWEVLEAAQEVWLRTERHPAVAGLPPALTVHSFDDLYEEADGFSEVYSIIADRILQLGRRPQGVVYAVPGHPLVGEATVGAILSRADSRVVSIHVVEGLSFVEPTLTALRIDALEGLQILDAVELSRRHHPPLNPDFPALVGQLYSRILASGVKLTLMNQYPDEHEVVLVHAAGTLEQRIVRRPLYQLDREDEAAANVVHLTALYVPPLGGVTSFEGLQETVAHLRAPEGCPWDREQTHESLQAGLLEEAYEAVTAIDQDDTGALQEELGDLLLQVLLHTQIATEAGEFKMPDVIASIDTKLKYRHPHVWGGRSVDGTQEVLDNWDELKREEKGRRSSLLDGVPGALPALQQADTYGQRVARVGFDWADVSGVAAKVWEELGELESASTRHRQEAELGDLLFAVANWARWL
ncbi:MAG: nucleoside triphosphate pyrophosphohydrolase, partial [Anaerolineae bacterium]